MSPIVFQCQQFIPKTAAVICAEITDMANWEAFPGYGPLPGIQSATYEKRTETLVGSRIRVQNKDGSAHVEEIYQWAPGVAVAMKLHEFTPPLRHLATHFTEAWQFRTEGPGTLVTRTFHLYPRTSWVRPALWLISQLFRRAIARHLALMAQ